MESYPIEELDARTRNRTRFRVFFVLGGLLLVGIFVAVLLTRRPENLERVAQKAQDAFDRGAYETALSLSEEVLERDPDHAEAALLAGNSAARLERFSEAIAYYDQITSAFTADYITARNAAGDLFLLKLHQLTEAEKRYRDALAIDPDDATANDRMAFLLGLTARQWEQIPFRLRLIRAGRFEPMHLLSLALADTALENPEMIAEYRRDSASLVAQARLELENQRFDECKKLLSAAIAASPDLVEARVQMGRFLFEHATPADFSNWLAELPKFADSHPETWALRARWAQKHGNDRQAVRCFGEALKRDPNHSRSNYQLGQLLLKTAGKDAAEPFLARAKRLRLFINTVKVAHGGDDGDAVKRAAELAESLGLIWESYAWASLADSPQSPFRQTWARPLRDRLKPQISGLPLERTSPKSNPVLALKLDDYPLPERPPFVASSKSKSSEAGDVTVSFEDRARAAGLHFQYFNGRESVKNGLTKMYEFSGGGVAVVDFDGDLLPDLYFTQGCRWPPNEKSDEHLDRLYRNTGDGRFEEVTRDARIHDAGFGQGVTVGDFNSDGLPDLFIANIGRNRLFQNNGDGTFTDVSATAGLDEDAWTSSCLQADLNGDGLADIYTVNYVTGKDVYSRTCRSGNRLGMCLPHLFAAAQDQYYINLGDGRFRNATNQAGFQVPEGKGLGIVAADFHDTRRLSLFIANDTTPNFFFRTNDVAKGPVLRFREEALPTGLAMNADGKTESCMGIAVGDADGDGRLDLFVTNFASETNTLYLQSTSGTFLDATARSGLGQASLPMVGFGTQFLDADLDGHLDLLITNGHIDDFRATNRGDYQMSPQFFSNRGNARFASVGATELGPYFQKKYLGRAMARLDWNADGREDAVITHLDSPAALLTNTTQKTGSALTLKLCGVRSNRDAIGTTVTLELDGRKIVRQLTAGDGYFASNERIMNIGVGAAKSIPRMTVRWRSGQVDEFRALPVNSRWIVVEGTGRLLAIPSTPISNSNRH